MVGLRAPAFNAKASGGTTISPSTWGAPSVGDIVYAVVSLDPSAGTVSFVSAVSAAYTTTAWNTVQDQTTGSGTSGVRLVTAWARVLTSLETSTLSVIITHPSAAARAAEVFIVRGADPTTPIVVSSKGQVTITSGTVNLGATPIDSLLLLAGANEVPTNANSTVIAPTSNSTTWTADTTASDLTSTTVCQLRGTSGGSSSSNIAMGVGIWSKTAASGLMGQMAVASNAGGSSSYAHVVAIFQPPVTPATDLVVANMSHAQAMPAADTMTQDHILSVSNLSDAQVEDAVSITQDHILVAQNMANHQKMPSHNELTRAQATGEVGLNTARELTTGDSGNIVVERIASSEAQDGAYVWRVRRLTTTGVLDITTGYAAYFNDGSINYANEGEEWTAQLMVLCSAVGKQVKLGLQWFGGAPGSTIELGRTYISPVMLTQNVWTLISVTAVAPVGTVMVAMTMDSNVDTLTTSEFLLVDKLGLAQTAGVVPTWSNPELTVTLSTDVVLSDLAQAQTEDSVSLTQLHVLSLVDITQGDSLSTVLLVQDHYLTTVDLSQINNLDSIAITQTHAIALSDMVQSVIEDAVTLTQTHILTTTNLTQTNVLDSFAITQEHILVVSSMSHSNVEDALVLTQAHILALVDLAQAISIESISLTQLHILVVSNLVQSDVQDSVSVTQEHYLVTFDLTQDVSETSFGISQSHSLVVSEIYQEDVLESFALEQTYILFLSDLDQVTLEENVLLEQIHFLSLEDISQLTEQESITVNQQHVLIISDLEQVVVEDVLVLGQLNSLLISDITQESIEDSVSLVQTHVLITQNILQLQLEDEASFEQIHILTVASLAQAESMNNLSISQLHSLLLNDVMQEMLIQTTSLTQDHMLSIIDIQHVQSSDLVSIQQEHNLTVVDISNVQDLVSFTILVEYVLSVDGLTQEHLISVLEIQTAAGMLYVRLPDNTWGKKPLYVWTGSEWKRAIVRFWNGSEWKDA